MEPVDMKALCDELNQHLTDGGVVQVGTCTRATVYTPKHAGWFSVGNDGCLRVKAGRGTVCLSLKDRVLVSIRKGHYRQVPA